MSDKKALGGLKSISEYAGFSVPTLRLLIKKYNFPVTQLDGTKWRSHQLAIDEWWSGLLPCNNPEDVLFGVDEIVRESGLSKRHILELIHDEKIKTVRFKEAGTIYSSKQAVHNYFKEALRGSG